MICLKQTKVTEWIISGNPEQYNVVDAFHNLHRVDWAQKANMTAGDIVYIYVSGNVKAIKFKCRVNKADLDESDIDDREYDLSGQFDGTAGRYMELELLEEYVGDEYSREELMKHGFRSPQGPIRMPESVKQYLESISVFEHRYPVNTAVWIATALLSAESFDSNPVCSKKDMYFKQTAIIQRAQKLAESSVANARCSQWCCADNDNSSNNYLRGDSEENSSLRRLSLLDEFPEKTHPEGLNMADELTMNGNKITMEELFYFVREQYPTIIGIEKTEAIKALEERGVLQEMREANKEFDKNLILYGPPGTGKTYNSATYAVAICDEKSVDELTDYDAVMKRYNELKEAGRIAFTTFHQSYGYEEFIEGIKPVVDDEATDISYTIESGVFKKFCDIAGTPENMEIDHNAQVWFVRLNGVGKNDLKEECFKEGTIRFSWENENVDDSYKKWFNMMSPGDYVVSYNGANVNIDGIGIIEDSEPFYDEQRSSFKWTRKVKWLVTDIVENIRELNGGKYLPNFEITKLNRVRISELLELVSKHGGYAGDQL